MVEEKDDCCPNVKDLRCRTANLFKKESQINTRTFSTTVCTEIKLTVFNVA